MRKLPWLQTPFGLPVLAVLLCGGGCVDFGPEGVRFCEEKPDRCAPVIEKAVQEPALPSGQIVFRVTAREGVVGRLAFQWEASGGTLEKGGLTNTSSVAIWKPPACSPMGQPGRVSVFIGNGFGEVSKEFKVSVAPCPTPTPVFPLTPTPSLSAFGKHSLALRSDGSVWAWGNNSDGQLGDRTTTSRALAGRVLELPMSAAAVSSGDAHSLALIEDGRVWAWGNNDYGQLGNGTNGDRSFPTQVSGLDKVVLLAAGSSHSLALRVDGIIWAWGNNNFRQLGHGSLDFSWTPVAVANLGRPVDVVALAAGVSYSMALGGDGSVWTWGHDLSGTSSAVFNPTPVEMADLPKMIAISAGHHHALALSAEGTVWAWGSNSFGQLGLGGSSLESSPRQIPGLFNIRAISAGASISMALSREGDVWAWGLNNFGQLGDGTKVDRHVPVRVSGVSGVSSLAAGDRHAMALGADESLWTWGDDGTGRIRLSPERVLIP